MQRIHSFYYLYKNIFYKNIQAKFEEYLKKKAEAEFLKRI